MSYKVPYIEENTHSFIGAGWHTFYLTIGVLSLKLFVYLFTSIMVVALIVLCFQKYSFLKKYNNLRCRSTMLIDQYPQCNLFKNNTTGAIFPIEMIWKKTSKDTVFLIKDSNEQHILPKPLIDIQQKALETISSKSIVYNQPCIRLFDLQNRDNTVILTTQRTMYFDSLITNRNMDYPLNAISSIRMMYEPGPTLLPLSDSYLSNHIGFSGIVESEDGVIILVQRSKYVSTNQNLFDCSVTASLKSQYALSVDKKIFTYKTWVNAVEQEIIDELNLNSPLAINFTTNNIIAFYRDLIEGGKPNFIFYIKINCDFLTIRKGLESVQQNNTNLVLQDGYQFRGIYHKDFIEAAITVARITVYTMYSNGSSKRQRETLLLSPQSSGVLQYIQDYLRGRNN